MRDSAFGRRKDRLEERAEATILVGAEEQASLPVGNRLGCWAMQAIPLARGLKAPAPQEERLYSAGDAPRCGRPNAGAGSETTADGVAFPCVIYLTDDKVPTLHNVRINVFEAAVTR